MEDGAVLRMIKRFLSCNSATVAPKLLYAVGVNLGAVTGFTASYSVLGVFKVALRFLGYGSFREGVMIIKAKVKETYRPSVAFMKK